MSKRLATEVSRSPHFESYTLLGSVESRRGGKPLRTVSVWLTDGYRGKH